MSEMDERNEEEEMISTQRALTPLNIRQRTVYFLLQKPTASNPPAIQPFLCGKLSSIVGIGLGGGGEYQWIPSGLDNFVLTFTSIRLSFGRQGHQQKQHEAGANTV